MRLRVAAIVPAAGFGKRLGSKIKKPFVLLAARPLIAHTLKVLNNSKSVDTIFIASQKPDVDKFKALVKKFRFKKVKNIIVGGRTRAESVRNCLRNIDKSFDIILIHDAVRPFVDEWMIEDAVDLADRFGACIVAIPESDTVKAIDDNLFIKTTLDRNKVYRAQTPQVFRRDIICKAYSVRSRVKGPGARITDDAGLVERLGKRVKILEGSYRNIKITTKEDLKFAEAIL